MTCHISLIVCLPTTTQHNVVYKNRGFIYTHYIVVNCTILIMESVNMWSIILHINANLNLIYLESYETLVFSPDYALLEDEFVKRDQVQQSSGGFIRIR